MNKWYNWPAKSNNNMVPWYKILWRLPFFITLLLGFSIMYLSILFMEGLRGAEIFRKDWF